MRKTEPRILVVGDLIIDRHIYGEVNRLSPEAPIPILDIKEQKQGLGGAGNVVKNLLNLGAIVDFMYLHNKNDPNLKDINYELFNQRNLYVYPIECENYKFPIKTRYISQNNIQLLRVDKEDDYTNLKFDHDFRIPYNFRYIDYIIVSDYNKGIMQIPNLMKTLTELKCIIAIDPKPVNMDRYFGATIITPNELEYSQMNRKQIINNGIQYIIHTKGKNGIELDPLDHMSIGTHFDAETSHQVIDACGCGDTLISTLMYAFKYYDLNDACYIANRCAGIVATKPGVAPITKEEYDQVINDLESINLRRIKDYETSIEVS